MADEQTMDTQNQEAEAAGEDLATRVQVLEEQLAAANDQALRVAADLQNVRRAPSRPLNSFGLRVVARTVCRAT